MLPYELDRSAYKTEPAFGKRKLSYRICGSIPGERQPSASAGLFCLFPQSLCLAFVRADGHFIKAQFHQDSISSRLNFVKTQFQWKPYGPPERDRVQSGLMQEDARQKFMIQSQRVMLGLLIAAIQVTSCSSACASLCMLASFLLMGCCGPYSCSASSFICQISERSLPISL